MVTGVRGRLRLGALRDRLVLSAVCAAMLLGGAVTSLDAQTVSDGEWSAIYSGIVFASHDGELPTKVRAISAGGVVCGTGTVEPLGGSYGEYELPVASSADRAGCPSVGETFHIRFVHGFIEDELGATQPATFATGERTLHVFIGATTGLAGFVGELPPPGGVSFMRWDGPGGTPLEHALATIDAEIAAVFHYDRDGERWRTWFAGAPSFTQSLSTLEAGQIVLVRRAAE
jgi:hypothetical protein